MEKLALTSKILYDHELLNTKKELKKYKQKYDFPKIDALSLTSWFERTWNAQKMLSINIDINDNNTDDEYIEKMLLNTKLSLKYLYKENYNKYELFFEEQIKQLENGLKIIQILNQWKEDNDIYDYIWHFLNILFEKINWMHCSGCNKYIQTCHGICYNCEISSQSSSDTYLDYQDMLADFIDH